MLLPASIVECGGSGANDRTGLVNLLPKQRPMQWKAGRMIGYQAHVDWMGERILTLADIWPAPCRAMIVGINPAPKSVEVGHYYQGGYGRQQMRRLAAAGVFDVTAADRYVEKHAVAAAIGFTDLVKRPTCSARHVRSDELEFGKQRLERELSQRDIPLIICVFKQTAVELIGRADAPGVQTRVTSWGARVFRMPGPTESNATARPVLATLSDLL